MTSPRRSGRRRRDRSPGHGGHHPPGTTSAAGRLAHAEAAPLPPRPPLCPPPGYACSPKGHHCTKNGRDVSVRKAPLDLEGILGLEITRRGRCGPPGRERLGTLGRSPYVSI